MYLSKCYKLSLWEEEEMYTLPMRKAEPHKTTDRTISVKNK